MLYIYSQKNHRFKLNKKTEKVGLRSIKKYIVLCNQGFTYLWKSQMCPSKKTNITNRYNRKHQK